MSKVYDVVFTVRPQKEGDKPRYINCGAVFETAKGLSMKLESIPVGFNGWLNLYEPRAKEQKQASSSANDFEEDSSIPF